MKQVVQNMNTFLSDPAIRKMSFSWYSQKVLGRQPAQEIEGMRFTGFPSFSSFYGASKHKPGIAEVNFLRRALPGSQFVVDAGANFGVMSALFSQIEKESTIIALEPAPETILSLKHNLEINNIHNVMVEPACLGKDVGFTDFIVGTDPATNRMGGHEDNSIRVPTESIDNILSKHPFDRIDFLKIDIEGAEIEALQGAANTFQAKLIGRGIIEVCPENLANFGNSLNELFDFFNEYNYSLYHIKLDGLEKLEASRIPKDSLLNAAFLSPEDPLHFWNS